MSKFSYILKYRLNPARWIPATILSIRFPFLYPRNRSDGKHRTYILGKQRNRLYNEALEDVIITARLGKDDETEHTFTIDDRLSPTDPLHSVAAKTCQTGTISDFTFTLDKERKKLTISGKRETREIDLNDVLRLDKFVVMGMELYRYNSVNVCVVVKPSDETDKTNYGFLHHYETFLIRPLKYKLYKLLSWVDENVLDNIFIIPSYTELGAMPKGWRKAFGIYICKDLKKALLADGGRKQLRRYGIDQIKEKYGELCWYDHGGNEETNKIIEKYAYISRHTCITCGKSADYVTRGWIEPYCKEHLPDWIDSNDEEQVHTYYTKEFPFYGCYKIKFDKKEETKDEGTEGL